VPVNLVGTCPGPVTCGFEFDWRQVVPGSIPTRISDPGQSQIDVIVLTEGVAGRA